MNDGVDTGVEDGVNVKYEGGRERQCVPLASLGNQMPGLLTEHRWVHLTIWDRKSTGSLGRQCFAPWQSGKIFDSVEETMFDGP